VIATAAGATILGDNIGYWIGRTLGRKVLLKWRIWIGLDQRKLDLGEYLFLRHGGKIVSVTPSFANSTGAWHHSSAL